MSIAADVSPERLRRFFTKVDGGYRVSKTLRDMCVFARQDLTRDPPFSRLDLIVCRNVLIYLDAGAAEAAASRSSTTRSSRTGFLMLGQRRDRRRAQRPVRARRQEAARLSARSRPTLPRRTMSFPWTSPRRAGPRGRAAGPAAPEPVRCQAEANRVILDRYAPAGRHRRRDMQIVQFRGADRAFLEPAPGRSQPEPAEDGARRAAPRAARARCRRRASTSDAVRAEGLRVRSNGDGWRSVDVEVVPLGRRAADALPGAVRAASRRREIAERAPARETAPREHREAGDASRSRTACSDELAASREYLQSIIQELEAANEELQSANEEILSSNEELQSTNEELDTAKEELQ